MEGIHEVDPSGDVIIILRNPGAPFAEAATEAEPADEESPAVATEAPAVEGAPAEDAPAIAADAVWFELPSTSKGKKDKKKNRKAIAEREEAAAEVEPAIAAEAAAIEEVPATEEVLAIEEALATEEAPAEEVVNIEENPTEEAPAEEAPAEEVLAVVAGEPAIEAKLVVEAELVADLDGLLGGGFKEQGEGRPLSEASGMQLRVSSRHLILASLYFEVALNGPWSEATSVSADCCRHIFADDWDPQAFLILMHIIHGRNRQVPRLVSLELLAKIAALVDYYKCHEAVEVFAELWLQGLKSQSQVPSQVGRDLVLWLFISWVFGDNDIFTSVTSTALQQSQGPLPTWGLPIPEAIIEAIDRRRQEVVDKIITALQSLLISFRDGPDKCSFECSSIQLGALAKEIRAKRLETKPESPMLGYSVVATMKTVKSIRSPTWHRTHTSFGYVHSCSLEATIRSTIGSMEQMTGGLTLDEFGRCSSLGHSGVL
ncbi:hypothetical protein C8A03DRAFT_39314 [Achaetomium macrosporum]|uniref:BTB domain-containing protein n=1 Tax=Achaetomium macrosporum TaxID=79813 RepID=A0AAN7H6H9_9PEZI|nr:hypothetical protein C8A03DRAFT_39314 [Achaetomium macrosporum]